uniref:Uncharacterized protein n=1 Tax=Magallana gigas TaxID=29159 RepID=K1QDH6_MAGGI
MDGEIVAAILQQMTRDRFAVGLAIGDGGEEGQEEAQEGLEVAEVEVKDQYKTLVNRSEQKLL